MKNNIWNNFFGNSSTENIKGIQSSRPSKKIFARAKKPTLDEALQLSSFWAAINRWTQTISSLPINFQKMDGDDWVPDTDSDLHKLFKGKVNRYQTRTEFFKELALNLFATGNCYAFIVRKGGKIHFIIAIVCESSRSKSFREWKQSILLYEK